VLGLYTPAAGTTPVGSLNLNGTANASNLSGAFANNMAGFVAALKAGTIYTNVHTSANPGGEIRAQVLPATAGAAPAQASPAAPKTGNAGLAGSGTTAAMAALLVVLATSVVVGGRLAVARRTR
jgi:hypothetical protein